MAPSIRSMLRPVAEWLVGSIVGVNTLQPVVTLTFDDGPDPEVTPALLDVLARHRARATFFVVGSRACAHPSILRQMQIEGHEVALHGRQHLSLTHCSRREAFDVIWRGKQELAALTDQRVRFFRPPHGEQDLAAWAIARAAGLNVVHWSADVGDWSDLGLPLHLSAAAEVKPGGIMLLHDGPAGLNATLDRPALLDRVLLQLATAGLTSIPVWELLGLGPPVRRFWLSPHHGTVPSRSAPG